jgi:hypothetical protein
MPVIVVLVVLGFTLAQTLYILISGEFATGVANENKDK